MAGMLIVNADDFGGNPLATERIAACFRAGRITSASAMVHMQDATAVSKIAAESGLPLGLHLNLTQRFEDEQAPEGVRERQAAAIERLAASRSPSLTLDPRLLRLARACLDDQLARFIEMFDRRPTHVDGHNHVHLRPSVLLTIPRGMPVRCAMRPTAKPNAAGMVLRGARHLLIASLHPTPARLFPIDPLAREPSEAKLERLLSHADRQTVEVMVHPDRDNDYRLLMSDRWAAALRRHRLGSFAELAHSA